MRRWLLLLGLGWAACEGSCGSEQLLATLTALTGSEVERDEAEEVGRWRRAQLSDGFYMGDGLRTGPDGHARLGLVPDGTAEIGPRTVLRFLPRPPQAPAAVTLEHGALTLAAEQMDIEVHTPRAVARVARGGRIKLSASGGRERFDLVVGRVQVVHAGTTRMLTPEQPLELGAPEAAPPAPSEPAPVEPPPAPAPPPVEPPAPAGWPPASPKSADLLLPELERATIHAASLPIDVYVPPPRCLEPKLVLNGKPASDKLGLLQLAGGSYRIRLLCGSRKVRESLLLVRRDAAKLELPKRPQQVRVEADGRHYTVRYQNLLPSLVFVWPDAPSGDLFTLVLRKGGHEASYQVSAPEHTLSGDAMREGDYSFWFLDAHGRSSKPGTLRLSFDNTARTAYLSAPVEGSSASGDQVLVAGTTLSGSQVTVGGRGVTLDDKGRFRAESPVVSGQRAVAVRIAHPESGVHYYLRRLR